MNISSIVTGKLIVESYCDTVLKCKVQIADIQVMEWKLLKRLEDIQKHQFILQ